MHTTTRQFLMKIVVVRIDEDIRELVLETALERRHGIIKRLAEGCRLIRLVLLCLLVDLLAVLEGVPGKLLEACDPRCERLDLGGSGAGSRTGRRRNERQGKLDEFEQSRARNGEFFTAEVFDDCVDEFSE